jgi:hypothetical protein
MPCDDWRQAGAAELAPWYAAERARWTRVLGWDPVLVLAMAEEARQAGRLAGFVARDDAGRITGVAYYNHERGALQIGALQAERADVVRDLLDRILESPEASFARRYQGFLFPPISGVDVALTRRRFDVMPQLYLGCRLDGLAPPAGTPVQVRPWRDEDVPAAARLLARAYAGTATGAAFAPEGASMSGRLFGAILHSPAAAFRAVMTVVIDGPQPERLGGLVLTTRLSPSTAPGAGGVDPDQHRRGGAR